MMIINWVKNFFLKMINFLSKKSSKKEIKEPIESMNKLRDKYKYIITRAYKKVPSIM